MKSAPPKPFNLDTGRNPLSLGRGAAEPVGTRHVLPAAASSEPLLRGCDQRQWLEKLKEAGISHLVVPFNGGDEDTTLYSRRHLDAPLAGGAETGAAKCKRSGKTLYDLDRRDEGVFARLQFLLDAAARIGMRLGFSLFDPQTPGRGPFARAANTQRADFSDAGAQNSRAAAVQQALEKSVDWIAAEMRGRSGVWIQIFRNSTGKPRSEAIERLEKVLAKRLLSGLAHAPDEKMRRASPCVLAPAGFEAGADAELIAPFEIHSAPSLLRFPSQRPRLGRNGSGNKPLPILAEFPALPQRGRTPVINRPALWSTALRGAWPIVPVRMQHSSGWQRCRELARISTFAALWVAEGCLRPCPELLAPLPEPLKTTGKIIAATNGCGRYFAYFEKNWFVSASGTRAACCNLTLATLPGSYRYYWFAPASGKGLDRGDGLAGGTQCSVPSLVPPQEALLILEQEELPDPLSIW